MSKIIKSSVFKQLRFICQKNRNHFVKSNVQFWSIRRNISKEAHIWVQKKLSGTTTFFPSHKLACEAQAECYILTLTHIINFPPQMMSRQNCNSVSELREDFFYTAYTTVNRTVALEPNLEEIVPREPFNSWNRNHKAVIEFATVTIQYDNSFLSSVISLSSLPTGLDPDRTVWQTRTVKRINSNDLITPPIGTT